MACVHDHNCEDHDCSADWSLYKHIDLSKVSALNEAVSGSVKAVFRAWDQRLNTSEGYLESNEDDPELIVFIPFTSDVKIKGISIVGGADGTTPAKMRAFINRDGIDFSDAQTMQPVQEWDLVENFQGVLEYQTRYAKFQSVASITLHFPENFGGNTTQIHYIGLKGEATQLKRDVVATIVYELMPNPSDHKYPTHTDPEVWSTMEDEKEMQFINLSLIANLRILHPERAVMEAVGSCLTNKYSELVYLVKDTTMVET